MLFVLKLVILVVGPGVPLRRMEFRLLNTVDMLLKLLKPRNELE